METTASVSKRTISETEHFSLIIKRAIENNYAVALWRLPNDSAKYLILSKKSALLTPDEPLEDLPTGFIVAPFENTGDRIYLKADFLFSFDQQKPEPPKSPLETSSATWLQNEVNGVSETLPTYYQLKYEPVATSENDFVSMVKNALKEIEKGSFEKIVPSRAFVTLLHPEFDVAQTFQELCEKNPNAFVSFVSTHETGSWIGATPELLVSVEDNKIFKTIALAATQAYEPGVDLKSVAWTQKDIEEQALVERYIVNSFKKIRLREFEEHGPKTVVAGNLLHLKSEFRVDMDVAKFPQLGSVMLQLLHPTSAVCGEPLEPSRAFLKDNEGYDRQFYSGYLGPVNFNNSIDIFVNLRCAQLLSDKAILYAGAGITADSVPDQEWEETQMKMTTLLEFFRR
jgi:isochorismate synthase